MSLAPTAATPDTPVAIKLESLLNLQNLDSQLDEIKRVRGDLPEEVRDLEDEIAGYETRVKKFDEEVGSLNQNVQARRAAIKEADALIKRYEEQQTNVRNNREYEAISKEIELQRLEIQIAEKKIREAQYHVDLKSTEVAGTKQRLNERKKDLENKKSELNALMAESEADEKTILTQRKEAVKRVPERELKAYTRLRGNMRNGLAVVTVRRDACGGCFNTVPPQRQADIAGKKKIIVCEHCGRILADVDVAAVAVAA
jgi:uncharacterized protein